MYSCLNLLLTTQWPKSILFHGFVFKLLSHVSLAKVDIIPNIHAQQGAGLQGKATAPLAATGWNLALVRL